MSESEPVEIEPTGERAKIITGQKVSSALLERAHELRRQMTPAEKILWEHLRNARFYGLHFRRQQIIGRYIADFYCHSAGLVIEVDGSIHDSQIDYDAERDRAISDHGLTVLRLTNSEIEEDLGKALERIKDELP